MSIAKMVGQGIVQGLGMQIGMRAGEKVLEKGKPVAGKAKREGRALARTVTTVPQGSAYKRGASVSGAIWSTPGEQLAAIRTARQVIEALNRDIQAGKSKLPGNFLVSWSKFVSEFLKFEKENGEGIAGFAARFATGGPGDKALDFQRRALEWRGTFEGYGGKTTTPKQAPLKPSGPDLEIVKWAALGLGGLLVWSHFKPKG